MQYTINTLEPVKLDFSAKGDERVLQNIRNLINTFRYEIAYNRTIGIDPNIFDKPADIAAALYTAEIYRIIADYEPRAEVKAVNFIGLDDDGNMSFEVVVDI